MTTTPTNSSFISAVKPNSNFVTYDFSNAFTVVSDNTTNSALWWTGSSP